MSNVKLTWIGHSCFKVTCDDYTIVLDPYQDDAVPGLGPVRETANAVFCSHDHRDHGAAENVTLVDPDKKNPFEVITVACPHDDDYGNKRGMNKIHIFDNGTVRIAHFGDIGCPLNEKQREMIGKLDAAMVPVGGFFTMEPEGIYELMQQLDPHVVIPMHYRGEGFGYDKIGTLDGYLQYVGGNITVCDENEIEIAPDMHYQTAILQFRG